MGAVSRCHLLCTKRLNKTIPKSRYRHTKMGEIMIIMAGYKTDPIKRSKLRMTVYFNVRRLFPGKWILEKFTGISVRGFYKKTIQLVELLRSKRTFTGLK